MKFNEQLKTRLLLVGLFVLLPTLLFFYSGGFLVAPFGKSGCLISSSGLFWLHIGLLFIMKLTRVVSWKTISLAAGIFISLCFIELAVGGIFGRNIDNLILYNAYNSLYLFGSKGLIETWKLRKERRVILSILLTCPLLVILGITAFVTFFFAINCF